KITGQRRLDGSTAKFAVSLGRVRVSHREKSAGYRHLIVHPRPFADPPVIDVAARITRRDRTHEIRFRWRQPHGTEVKSCRYPYIAKDIFAFADGRVIDPHTGIVDRG